MKYFGCGTLLIRFESKNMDNFPPEHLIRSTSNALTVANVTDCFVSLGESELSREQIYKLSMAIIRSPKRIVTEEVADEIGEFVTVLVGHCAQSCIIRLGTDPPDLSDEELTSYVRNLDWTSDESIRPSC